MLASLLSGGWKLLLRCHRCLGSFAVQVMGHREAWRFVARLRAYCYHGSRRRGPPRYLQRICIHARGWSVVAWCVYTYVRRSNLIYVAPPFSIGHRIQVTGLGISPSEAAASSSMTRPRYVLFEPAQCLRGCSCRRGNSADFARVNVTRGCVTAEF